MTVEFHRKSSWIQFLFSLFPALEYFTHFWIPFKFIWCFSASQNLANQSKISSSFGHIFSNSEFLLRFLNSQNFEIGIQSRSPFDPFWSKRNSFQNLDQNSICQYSIKKVAEFQLWTYKFFWGFLNSRNFEIGIQTRIPFVRILSKKQLNLTLFFHIFSSFGTFYHGWSRRFHPFSWTRDHRKVC